ncbi:MAG: hypothetical protein R3Y04_01930 [Rikenellaceae bacterium]
MKKVNFALMAILSFSISIVSAQVVHHNQVDDEYGYFNLSTQNNENLMLIENKGDEPMIFSIDKSFMNSFDSYKNLFPELAIAEVSYYTLQFSDKNYSLNWIIKDKTLYLAKLSGGFDANDKLLEEINGDKRLEKFVGQKFDVDFNQKLKVKDFASNKIMKASWVNGKYHLFHHLNSTEGVMYEVNIKEGEVVSLSRLGSKEDN